MVSSRFLLVPAGVLASLRLNLVDVHRKDGSPKSIRTDSTGTPNSVRSTLITDIVNTNSGLLTSDHVDDNAGDLEREEPDEGSEASFATGYEGPHADDENTTGTRNGDDQIDEKHVANKPKAPAQIVPIPANLMKGVGSGRKRKPSTSWVVPEGKSQKALETCMKGTGPFAGGHYILPANEVAPSGKDPKELILDTRRLTEVAQDILVNSRGLMAKPAHNFGTKGRDATASNAVGKDRKTHSTGLRSSSLAIGRFGLTGNAPRTRQMRQVKPKTKTPKSFVESLSNTTSTNDRKIQSAGFVTSDGLDDSAEDLEGEQPDKGSEISFTTGYEGSDADGENTTETRDGDDQTDERNVANNPKDPAQNNTWKEMGLNLVEQAAPSPLRLLVRAARLVEKLRSAIATPQKQIENLRKCVRNNPIPPTCWDVPKGKSQKALKTFMKGAGSSAGGLHILPANEVVRNGKEPKELILHTRRLTEVGQDILMNSRGPMGKPAPDIGTRGRDATSSNAVGNDRKAQSAALLSSCLAIGKFGLARNARRTRQMRQVKSKTKTEPSAIAESRSNTTSTNDQKTQSAGFVFSYDLDDNAQDLEGEQPDESSDTSFATGYEGSDADGEDVWNYRNPIPCTSCIPNELAKMALETWMKDERPTVGEASPGEKDLDELTLGVQSLTLED